MNLCGVQEVISFRYYFGPPCFLRFVIYCWPFFLSLSGLYLSGYITDLFHKSSRKDHEVQSYSVDTYNE